MRFKRFMGFMLCFVMLFSLIPAQTAMASMDYLRFKNGAIEMRFTDTKAKTDTVFHTVGWIMHPSRMPNRDAYNHEKVGVLIKGTDYQETKRTDLGNGKIATEFYIDTQTTNYALAAAEMGGTKSGEPVYFDSVFEVLVNGKSTGRYYYTYNDIKSAAPWGSATLDDLKYYYNISVTYDSSTENPLSKEIIVNGQQISKQQIDKGKTGDVFNVTFDPTISYGGSTATIKKSYFYYDLKKDQKLFELDASDSRVCNRNATMYAGGITVVAEYSMQPKVKVEHYNLDTKSLIETEPEITVNSGDTVTKSAKTYPDINYGYSEVSEDGGNTWKLRSTNSTRNIIVNKNTIIRFNYAKDTSLMAALTLTADPNIIEEGKTATVNFALDASQSKADNGIAKYEFWFSKTDKFEDTPNWTITSNYQETKESNVAPNTTRYGKVRITDKKGKTAEATAEVTIGSKQSAPTAEITPKLVLKQAGDNPNVLAFKEAIGGMNGLCIDSGSNDDADYRIWDTVEIYQMDILVGDDYKTNPEKYQDMSVSVQLDASDSESTNGIGSYEFISNYGEYNNSDGSYTAVVQKGGSSVSKPFDIKLGLSPADVASGTFSNKYEDSSTLVFCRMIDSAVPTCKASTRLLIQYKYVFNTAPDVQLAINQNSFALGETAKFTPTFTEGTYPIQSKSWSIQKKDSDFIESGDGEIPSEYKINLSEGNYTARQYITYRNRTNNDITDYAEVEFDVYAMKPPTVNIKSDKEKYYIPTTGIFTVLYGEDPKYSYQIADRKYEFKTEDGKILSSGDGTFPSKYDFTDDLASGYYIASETIYWWQAGEYKSATATCKVKLISPVPTADFSVSMKMDNTESNWLRLDGTTNHGKIYKQLRIDLTPCDALNAALENPNHMDYTSANTQIKITPTTQAVSDINTYTASDLAKTTTYTLTSGKQYLDVRFDKPGDYTISCRVSSGKYVSPWVTKTITINDDLPPKVSLTFGNISVENGVNKVYRATEDLHAKFRIDTTVTSQDDDTPDYSSAKLNFRFDYNANGDTADDGVHSSQYITKDFNNVQNYVSVTKNETMTNFLFDMFDNTKPMLGKMYFEYQIAEKPTIPNYVGGNLPAIPTLYGTTESMPVDDKVLWIDNTAGIIKVTTGKEGKKTFIIMMSTEGLSFNLQDFASYYKDCTIYLIHPDGRKELYQ